MREGWEYKKLGEVAISDLGKTLNKAKDVGKHYPYLCAINILWDKIDLTSLKTTCFEEDELEKYSVKCGDLLICEGGDTGRSAIWDKKETILYQNALHRVRTDDSLDARFLMYYLWQLKKNGEIDHKYSKGVTIKHLVKSSLMSIPVPIPPKSVQLEIVSELDQINELIRLKKEQLKDYDDLAQSIFYEMFGDPVENEKGWEVKKLGDIAAFKNGLNFSKAEKGIAYKFLGVSDFQDNTTVCSGSLGAIELSQPLSEEYFLEEGDIVFVRSNGSKELVGRNVLMHISEPTTYSGFCIRCRLMVEGWNAVFLSFLLKTSSMRPLITNSGRGCNISNLNQKILGALPVIDVPFESQQEFSSRISQVERQKAEVSNAIADLETLLASRMQYWFE